MTYSTSDFYADVIEVAVSRRLLEQDGDQDGDPSLSDEARDVGALLHELADRRASEAQAPREGDDDLSDREAARIERAALEALAARLFEAGLRVLNEHDAGRIEPHAEDADGALAELGAACDAYRTAGEQPDDRDPSYSREDSHHITERG